MISLSLRSSAPPTAFQRRPVRPSAPRYRGFGLAKDSSTGFWSTARDSKRPFRTRFRCGSPPEGLTSPRAVTRGLIMQKACGHPRRGSHSSWACGFRSVSLPSRGSFHLSLAVLVRYRSSPSIQPWGVGPPDSDGVSRVPPYLGSRWASARFRIRGVRPLCRAFPGASPAELSCRVAVPQPQGASPLV